MATNTNDHVCHVDCDPSQGGHMMYPAEPNRDAGRYQAEKNATMTRREYRASGQDESRNVRQWNYDRANTPVGQRPNIRVRARVASVWGLVLEVPFD